MDIRLLIAFSLICLCNGYKVLFMGPFNGKSHFLYLQHFVRALLNRGHEVTFLTSQSMAHLKLANYTEVLIDPPFDVYSLFSQEKLIEFSAESPFSAISQMGHFTGVMNEYAFQSANVQKLIHSTDLHFDVVINEEFFADSFLMFAHKFKAPMITICPFGLTNYVDYQHGLLTTLSISPHWMLPYTDNMTFYERFYNVVLTIYDWIVRERTYVPAENSLTQKYFSHLGKLPSIDELRRNVSVTFINTHRALSPPRPAMPGIVSVGGAHLSEGKPLPKDLQTFLDESKDGVIYFSLGTVLHSSKLPKEKIQAFIDSFRHLKQRVLWKFEDESLTDIPANVMIRKWMPQNDILAHPNVVLFISHGGLFGTSESLYHGVPLLLIPFFGDQHRNAHRIAVAGYGQFLPFGEVSENSLRTKIIEILSDKSYLTKAKQTSAIFKDNLVHPMDEAMFWIEHVAKFKGAKHLKSHAVNLTLFTYLQLDVLIVTIMAISILLFASYTIIIKACTSRSGFVISDKKRQ